MGHVLIASHLSSVPCKAKYPHIIEVIMAISNSIYNPGISTYVHMYILRYKHLVPKYPHIIEVIMAISNSTYI